MPEKLDLDLDALEAAEKAATPAPWDSKDDECDGMDEAWCYWHRIGPLSLTGKEQDADSSLLLALRNAAPALIARARMCERMADALRQIETGTPRPSFESVVTPVQNWALSNARTVLREWDALNEKGGAE